jgi:hypothetical protein
MPETWCFALERFIGDCNNAVHNYRNPEANIARTTNIHTTSVFALEQRGDDGALLDALVRPKRAEVVVKARPGVEGDCDVVLHNLKRNAVLLSPREQSEIERCIWYMDPVLSDIFEAFVAALPAPGAPRTTAAARLWFSQQRSAGHVWSPEQERAMDPNNLPVLASTFLHADTRGVVFRSRDLENAQTKTFNSGVISRFDYLDESIVYYGEAILFYRVTFCGRDYALCDAQWYEPDCVVWEPELGLMVAALNVDGTISKWHPHVDETFVNLATIGGQFFHAELVYRAPGGGGPIRDGVNPTFAPIPARPLPNFWRYRVLFENRVVGQARPDNDYPL